MNREFHKWYSPALGRDMELLVFGHAGTPLLIFPTSMGKFYEYEDRGMVSATWDKFEHGQLQAFCVDSVDTESWYAKWKWPGDRIWRHMQYEQYLIGEVLPLIRHRSGRHRTAVAGASFGGYHAVNFAFRNPGLVSDCVSMSGAFDIHSFLGGYWDDNAYYNNPPDYVRNLTDHGVLTQMRQMRIVLGTSNWDICLQDNLSFSRTLHDKAIPHYLDVWGDGHLHDWPLWHQMVRKYF